MVNDLRFIFFLFGQEIRNLKSSMIRPNKIAPNMYIRGAEMPRIIDLCPGFIQRILTNAQTQSPKRHMLTWVAD